MKHIKKISDYSIVGGMGAIAVIGLVGCEDHGIHHQMPEEQGTFQEASKAQGAFVVIEEIAPKKYKIVNEYPANETRVILKTLDGKEKILSKEELDKLVKEEASKIDAGTSELTQEQVSSGDGGMGLGGVILSSMAGAVLGSWIGNKLFGNPNYQHNRRASYKNTQTFNRSKSSFNRARASRKSGYFNKNRNKGLTTRKRSSGFFGSYSTGSRRFGG